MTNTPQAGSGVTDDGFRGDNAALCASIAALLSLDESGALAPHGIGGHARTLLKSAAARLATPAAGAGGGVTQPLTVSVCYFEEGDDPFVFQCNGRVTASVLADIDKDLRDNRDTLFPDGPGDYEFSVTRYHGQYGEYGRCELAPGWEFDQIGFKPLPEHPDAAILATKAGPAAGVAS